MTDSIPAIQAMTDVLVTHQRHNHRSCLCGWAKLGHSHPEHQALMLANAGIGYLNTSSEGWDSHDRP